MLLISDHFILSIVLDNLGHTNITKPSWQTLYLSEVEIVSQKVWKVEVDKTVAYDPCETGMGVKDAVEGEIVYEHTAILMIPPYSSSFIASCRQVHIDMIALVKSTNSFGWATLAKHNRNLVQYGRPQI